MSKIKTVSQIPSDYIFVSDSQEVASIRESFRVGSEAKYYDSFFVRVGEGEYTSVYGMSGVVPTLSKLVREIL